MIRATSIDQQYFEIPVQSIVYDQLVETASNDQNVILPLPFSSNALSQFTRIVNGFELTAETYKLVDFLDQIHIIYIKCMPIPSKELLPILTPAIQEYFSLFQGDNGQQINRVINYFKIRGKLDQIDLNIPGGPNRLSIKNCTLISASERGHLKIVRILLSSGINVHDRIDYSFSSACQNGHLEVMQALLSAGADLHAANDLALR